MEPLPRFLGLQIECGISGQTQYVIGRYYQEAKTNFNSIDKQASIALLVIKISPAQFPPRWKGAPSKSASEDSKCWSNNHDVGDGADARITQYIFKASKLTN